jgi:hypothetical protein
VVIDLTTDRIRSVVDDLPSGVDVYGVSDREVVYDANCDRPCPAGAMNLATGVTRPVGLICTVAWVVPTTTGGVLVSDGDTNCANDRLKLTAVPLDDPNASRVVYEPVVPGVSLVPSTDEFTASLPDGWFLVGAGYSALGGQPAGLPALAGIESGEVIPLPPLEPQ